MTSTVFFLVCLTAIVCIPVHGRTYGDYTVETEYGYEADGVVNIEISRVNIADPVSFKVQVLEGTGSNAARSPADFTSAPTPVSSSFAAGSSTVTVTVPIVDDGVEDPGEFFRLRLIQFSNGDGAFTAVVYIVDNSPIDFNCPSRLWARENDGTMRLRLRRSWDQRHGPIDVTINTADDEAVAGEDYDAIKADVVTIDSGQLTHDVIIDIIDDVIRESTEVFTVGVTWPSGSCTVTATIADDDIPDPFHCGRGSSQPCLNGGTCNQITGACDCPGTYYGANCGAEGGTQTGCDDRCGANGWCQSDNAAPGSETITCVCKPGWAGAYCNYSAYYHQCNTNSISFCITPYGIEDFEGKIYVLDKKDEFACTLEPALGWPAAVLPKGDPGDAPIDEENIPNWCRGYAIELDYNGGVCGDFGPINDEGSIQEYRAEVVVQYSSNRMSSLDELVTASCMFDAQDLLVHTNLVEFSPSESFLKKQTSSLGFSPAVMTVTRPGGAALPAVIQMDDWVKVCVSVEDASDWNCLVTRTITINNTRSGANFREAMVYEEGCIDSAYSNVITEPLWVSNTEEDVECFLLRPFVFDDDIGEAPIFMGIELSVSLAPDDSCTELICGDRKKRPTNNERKKRSTNNERKKRSTNNERENIMGYVLTIETPAAVADNLDGNTGEPKASTATRSQQMLPIIIGASVGGALLVVLTSLLVFLVSRRRNYQEKEQRMY